MTSNNLNILLTNALCCIAKNSEYVSKSLSLGKKCYNEDLAKLKLANDYIEILKCYKLETTDANFIYRFSLSNYINYQQLTTVGRVYIVTVNNIQYSQIGDGIFTKEDIYLNILNSIPEFISSTTIIEDHVYVNVKFKCNITSCILSTNVTPIVATFINNIPGNCTIENTITEENFIKMTDMLMEYCNICDCQLT